MATKLEFKVDIGSPTPYGVIKLQNGYNFSLFSKQAKSVSLCLFDPANRQLLDEIPFDPQKNKTGDVWHLLVSDLPGNLLYGYRIDGPYDAAKGLHFDKNRILIDPYAKGIATDQRWGEKHYDCITNLAVVDPTHEPFDWKGDKHPNIPLNELIIYEMHVRGFTVDPSSHVKNPGTFLGMIEKIPHLKSLGVNAVELMPIFEFNESEYHRTHPTTGKPLYNYWGYSTVNFFSLMNRYGSSRENTINEFKALVKALHENGIEVILDVVYNHTSEGYNTLEGINKETYYSFKGIENSTYYILGPKGEYYNYSGCGNSFNANHPRVRELIIDSLRYWVQEMHIDGFRFDLASALTRSMSGAPLESPPLIEAIAFDPILANTKLIAEAWDAAALYQVGTFPAFGVWAEWNGKYRDDVREFVKGTDGKMGIFATRLTGSEDLYGKGRAPYHSINFITSHDGFSLHDLVTYNGKRNIENGEENKDGDNNNLSWNCEIEGETPKRRTNLLRYRQMRNFMLSLMVSQGVPMILMGDEYGHTKNGNNNTWCHDGPLNWFNWNELDKSKDLMRFFSLLIDFRKKHPVLRQVKFVKEGISWHSKKINQPDWGPKSRFLGLLLVDPSKAYELYIAFNIAFRSQTIELPKLEGDKKWLVIADTSKNSPKDIAEEANAEQVSTPTYRIHGYSSIILKSALRK